MINLTTLILPLLFAAASLSITAYPTAALSGDQRGKPTKEEPMIALPKPDYRGMPLEEALKNRRSIRRFSESRALSLSCLSQLLFAGQGVADSPFGPSFRTAPSAGATYPFDLYVVANNVEGLPPGLYRYEASHHSLISVKEGALGNLLAAAALGQKAVASAGATLVLAATFARTCARYGDR
ncbi:MAG: SagB/ThcOx family dehydrogenase, partial [Deltaproteobacteria bacterium]|nr:SagB/ThcOx family dehydrogenase [Deltaproteobacteria bacterium]